MDIIFTGGRQASVIQIPQDKAGRNPVFLAEQIPALTGKGVTVIILREIQKRQFNGRQRIPVFPQCADIQPRIRQALQQLLHAIPVLRQNTIHPIQNHRRLSRHNFNIVLFQKLRFIYHNTQEFLRPAADPRNTQGAERLHHVRRS